MINVSLIGVSGYASLYLKNLERLGKKGMIRLVSALVHDPGAHQPEIMRLKAMGAKVFEEDEAFFSYNVGEVALCCIPTGIPSHGSLSAKALNNGWNVMVEKPAAASIQEIDTMMALAAEVGKEVYVGYQHMYTPEVWQIKEALLSGEIGELEGLYCMGLWPRAMEYFDRNTWAGRVVLDGQWVYDSVLHNAFGHFLNLLCFWSGSERNASARTKNVEADMYRTLPIESFDTCSVKVTTESGTPLFMSVSHNSRKQMDPVIRIQGSKGSLVWSPERYTLNGTCHEVKNGVEASFDRARSLMFDNVIAHLNGEAAAVCDLQIARVPTEVVNTMHRDFPITNVDPELLEPYENELGKHVAIKGIEEAVCRSYENGELLGPLALETT